MGSSNPESWTDEQWADWAWENLSSPRPIVESAEDLEFLDTVYERIDRDDFYGDRSIRLTEADRHWKFAKLNPEWRLRFFHLAQQEAALEEADRQFGWLTPGMKKALGGATVVVVLASGITYAVTRDGPTPIDEPAAAQPEPSPAPASAEPADDTGDADAADEPAEASAEAPPAEPSTEEPAEPDVAEPATEDPASSDEATAEAVPNGWDDVGDNGSSGRPPAEGGDGADTRLLEVFAGSTIFELTVEGDGETMSTAPSTLWYNPRFIVNNDPATNFYDDDSGFSVDVKWDRDGLPEADVRDAQNELVPDAAVDVTWETPSLLRVVVDGPDGDVSVTRARLELSVRTQDDAGNTVATFEDDAFWEAEE